MTNKEAAKWIQLYLDEVKEDLNMIEKFGMRLNEKAMKIMKAFELGRDALIAQEQLANDSPKLDSDFGDLISRQVANAAICNACGKIDCDQMDTCEKIDIPSINSSEIPNSSDTISRKAAIEHLKKRLYETELNSTAEHPYYEEIAVNRVDIWMIEVPSAQPETPEKRTETHACDCISRKMVLALPRNKVRSLRTYEVVEETINVTDIEHLPSAQPEHTSNNDCNGCKFVGCYDTDFPCANCIRKNKDYYAPERRVNEQTV